MPQSNLTISKSAQKIQSFLYENNLDLNIIELNASTRTANEAAAAIGCQVAQIIKSLIFQTKTTNHPLLILASGINRVNEKTIEQALNMQIVKADADYTKKVTGFAIGGIPPVGHTQLIETIIDEELLQFDELWAAAGTQNAVFKLSSKDLIALTKGTIIPIK